MSNKNICLLVLSIVPLKAGLNHEISDFDSVFKEIKV